MHQELYCIFKYIYELCSDFVAAKKCPDQIARAI